MAPRLVGVESTDPWLPDIVKTHAAQAKVDDVAGNFAAGDVEGVLAEIADQLDDIVATGGGLPAASDAETIAGTLTTKAVTPSGLAYERPYIDVRTYNVKGDGTTDDTAAFQAAINAAAGKTLLIPAGFVIRTTATINIPSNVRVSGYGAKVVNANTTGANDRFLALTNVTKVIIEGVELDGNRAAYASVTEQRHGIYLQGASYVTLVDVYSHDNKGDGLYVGLTATPSSDVTCTRCRFEANHRNNCSISSARRVKATNCRFVGASGTAPQAGIDIEPNTDTDIIDDIEFLNCHAADNVSSGFDVFLRAGATAPQRNISWIGGTISGAISANSLTGAGVLINCPNNVRIIGATIVDNGAEGIYCNTALTNQLESSVIISNCIISRNGRGGVVINRTNNVSVIGCTLVNNGAAAPNTLDGITMAPSVATSGFQIIGNRFDGTNTRYAVRISTAFVSGVTILANSYGTLGTGPFLASDDIATRFRLDQSPFILPYRALSSSYTLVAEDLGKYISETSASATTITVPDNATVPFAIGSTFRLARLGGGAMNVVGAAGVTIFATPGPNLRAQYSTASLFKTQANTWLLDGDLA